jgi:riboflavin kinase / FMN adenylyltransferase
MQLATLLPTKPLLDKPTSVTIGTFDGVHLGHQALLTRVHGPHPSVVISFDPNPSQLLTPEQPKQLLCTVAHRLDLLEQAAVDWVYLLPFTQQLAAQTAEQFLTQLCSAIPMEQLVLGPTARLGCDRATPDQIANIAQRLQFTLTCVDAICVDELPVSSNRIRAHLAAGELEQVQQCLGRPYSVRGRIVGGQRLGRQLGYPTANLRVDGLALPPLGIYAAECHFQNQRYPSMAYLGQAPTVYATRETLLETNLLVACEGLTSGDEIEVTLHALLRPDAKFPTISALVAQMDRDRDDTLAWFSIKTL